MFFCYYYFFVFYDVMDMGWKQCSVPCPLKEIHVFCPISVTTQIFSVPDPLHHKIFCAPYMLDQEISSVPRLLT